MPHVSRSAWSAARRLSQVVCLAAFGFLLVRSEFTGSFRALSGPVRLPWPVSAFLEADPELKGALFRMASRMRWQRNQAVL